MLNSNKMVEEAQKIADSIGSPWGEGANYGSIFDGNSPKLDIKKESDSHLDNDDWKLLVEDIVFLLSSSRISVIEEVEEKLWKIRESYDMRGGIQNVIKGLDDLLAKLSSLKQDSGEIKK